MHIVLMMAMTADGKIAKSSDHFPDWTSKEDKKLFMQTSKEHGAVIMGDKTFYTFPKPLPDRLNVVFTLQEDPPQIENVKWVSGEPEKVLQELEEMGYKSVILGGGAYLNTQFLERKLIDEIWITVEPKIFGGGLGIFNGPAHNNSQSDSGRDLETDLRLLSVEKINDNSVILKYSVLK